MDLRASLRTLGQRRVSGQIVKPIVVDNKVKQNPQTLFRASALLTPMHPKQIAIKPEGQREWKWWTAISATKLEVEWFLVPDDDGLIAYEVMTDADWGRLTRVYVYDFVERPKP